MVRSGRLLPKLWGCALGFGLGIAFSACDDDQFECTSDAQCVTAEREGVCQSDGWCSFLDPDCPSLYRYGELAPPHIANTCVPVEVVEEGTGAPDLSGSGVPPGGPSAGADSRGSGAADGASGVVDDTGSGDETPVQDGSTTGGGGTTTGPSSTISSSGSDTSDPTTDDGPTTDDAGTDTEDPPPPVCDDVLVFDDFNDGEIDTLFNWHRWSHVNTAVNESGSSVTFELVNDAVGGNVENDHAGIATREFFDMNSTGYVRVKVDEYPPSDTVMRLYVQVAASMDNSCQFGLRVEDDVIWADDVGEAGMLGSDTEWLQLRVEDGVRHVERSVDGITFEDAVDPHPLDCDYSLAQALVFGGVVDASPGGLTTSVDSVEVCRD